MHAAMPAALALPKSADGAKHRIQMIMCPPFWKLGTFQGGTNREWPGAVTPECSNIAYRVSRRVETLGEVLLHEYTHVEALVQPSLEEHVKGLLSNFYDSRKLSAR